MGGVREREGLCCAQNRSAPVVSSFIWYWPAGRWSEPWKRELNSSGDSLPPHLAASAFASSRSAAGEGSVAVQAGSSSAALLKY